MGYCSLPRGAHSGEGNSRKRSSRNCKPPVREVGRSAPAAQKMTLDTGQILHLAREVHSQLSEAEFGLRPLEN